MTAIQTNETESGKWEPGTGKALKLRIKQIMANVRYGERMTFSMALAQAKSELGVK